MNDDAEFSEAVDRYRLAVEQAQVLPSQIVFSGSAIALVLLGGWLLYLHARRGPDHVPRLWHLAMLIPFLLLTANRLEDGWLAAKVATDMAPGADWRFAHFLKEEATEGLSQIRATLISLGVGIGLVGILAITLSLTGWVRARRRAKQGYDIREGAVP